MFVQPMKLIKIDRNRSLTWSTCLRIKHWIFCFILHHKLLKFMSILNNFSLKILYTVGVPKLTQPKLSPSFFLPEIVHIKFYAF